MVFQWQDAFSEVKELPWKDNHTLLDAVSYSKLSNLKRFLDFIHIKFCLLRPFFQREHYPVVSPQELLPSFESSLYEYTDLPGFSLILLDRPINYFQEMFQFDILHCIEDVIQNTNGPASPFEPVIIKQNQLTFESRLPRQLQEEFNRKFENTHRITELASYPILLNFLLHMDRAHVFAKNQSGEYYFSGIYGSFPSDLDRELKKFGLKIGKFAPKDNQKYELNRNFVYQFLMELYGFPIAGERRTSAALFARKLFKKGDNFLIRVLGQSDRTITTLHTDTENKNYPKVEKLALVSINRAHNEKIKHLRKGGFILGEDQPVVIVRAHYRQHKYDPNNIRTDRAMSLIGQEIIHPVTGEIKTSVNILKDATYMTVILNDIVKGEYYGRIKYKRNEIIENTETHTKRLKFLYAWLCKNQRRMIAYSDEFFSHISKVLDKYFLDPNNKTEFEQNRYLYQEVWNQYKYIQQARKIKLLEDLQKKRYKGKNINYLDMLKYSTQILQELKGDLEHYFETLLEHAILTAEKILDTRYLINRYIHPPWENLSEYGKDIRRTYEQLVQNLEDLKNIKSFRSEQGSNNKSYFQELVQ